MLPEVLTYYCNCSRHTAMSWTQSKIQHQTFGILVKEDAMSSRQKMWMLALVSCSHFYIYAYQLSTGDTTSSWKYRMTSVRIFSFHLCVNCWSMGDVVCKIRFPESAVLDMILKWMTKWQIIFFFCSLQTILQSNYESYHKTKRPAPQRKLHCIKYFQKLRMGPRIQDCLKNVTSLRSLTITACCHRLANEARYMAFQSWRYAAIARFCLKSSYLLQ